MTTLLQRILVEMQRLDDDELRQLTEAVLSEALSDERMERRLAEWGRKYARGIKAPDETMDRWAMYDTAKKRSDEELRELRERGNEAAAILAAKERAALSLAGQ